jgi:hypothetical protein
MFEKYANIKFCENPFSRRRVVPSRRTDTQTGMDMLIVVFLRIWNACKKETIPLTGYDNTNFSKGILFYL